MSLMRSSSILLALVLCSVASLIKAEDKKGPPVIKVVMPLGISPGKPASIVVRGFKLNDVNELRWLDQKTTPTINIKSKGPAKPSDKAPVEQVGDSQVELEVTFPTDTVPGIIRLVAVSPDGQSEPQQLVVLDASKTVTETEPNDGFSKAQEITLGQTVVGSLAAGQNVDVFRFTGKAGQKVTIEPQAARLGSALDPFLMLHNAQGQLLAELDDGPEGADPILKLTLPADGTYYLTLMDANDKESPMHVYLLSTQ